MDVKKSKEQFIADVQRHIEMRNKLEQFYNDIYLPTLAKFNGKVYNIRFIKALREQAEKFDTLISVRERKSNGWDGSKGEIEVCMHATPYTYIDTESIYLPCNLNAGRIDENASALDTARLENWRKYSAEYQATIDDYDEFMRVAEETEKAVERYNALPYMFRDNLHKLYIY